jgi:hypothetical protein
VELFSNSEDMMSLKTACHSTLTSQFSFALMDDFLDQNMKRQNVSNDE